MTSPQNKSSVQSPLASPNLNNTGSSLPKSDTEKFSSPSLKESSSKSTPKIMSSDMKHTPTNIKSTPKSAKSTPKMTPNRDLTLPTHRIKMIMKSCPDVESVAQEPLYLIARATELFVQSLAADSLDCASSCSKLDYEALSKVVHSTDYLDFLKETIPKKITWAECQKLIEEKTARMEELI